VPRRFVHDYGTRSEIDVDPRLDAAGIRSRISPIL
jgi:hypothetical protein